MAVLGLRFCARAFSSCGKWGTLLIVVRRPLTVAASLIEEHRLQTCRLSNCGSRAQLLRGMWDLPRPGLEPVSPALAGRFSTTAPPGKPSWSLFNLLEPCRIILTSFPRTLFFKCVQGTLNHFFFCLHSPSASFLHLFFSRENVLNFINGSSCGFMSRSLYHAHQWIWDLFISYLTWTL